MLSALLFALKIILPNLILMGLGFLLNKFEQVSKAFIDDASKLVFNYALPCLLFFSVADSDVNYAEQVRLILAGVVVTLMLFIGSEIYARKFIAEPADQGVFVQGVFRSNMAIIGLATVANAYGSEGLSVGAVYMGIVTILFNILAVITLSRAGSEAEGDNPSISMTQKIGNAGKKMATNPLIWALVLAFVYKALPFSSELLSEGSILHTVGDLLASTALPLALICAGATIKVKAMLHPSGLSMQASIGRIVIAPLLAVGVGVAFGLQGVALGVLFMMVASPTAAASYVMAKAMGGNEVLAANILAFTTVVSLFGMALGMAVLRGLGWA